MSSDSTPGAFTEMSPATERRFGPLTLEEMSPAQRVVADAILAGPRGSKKLWGPFEALLHSPGLADPAQRLGEHVRFHTSIPDDLNELAVLLVARRWNAQFEFFAHRRLALQAGLDGAIISAVARGERPVLDDDAAAVYEFASQLLTSGDVTDDAFDAVVGRWGKSGAADLIGTVGYFCFVAFVLNVDRYPVPGEPPLSPR